MENNIFTDQEKLENICRRHHINKLSLVGSKRNGTNKNESDFDLLVEYEVGQKPGLFGLIDAEMELSELVGAKVGLRTGENLNPIFKQINTNEKQLIYVSQ